jgi:hypothetical protein
MQLVDEFVLAGQSAGSQGRSSPQIENFHPQASSLTTGDQQQKTARLYELLDMPQQ